MSGRTGLRAPKTMTLCQESDTGFVMVDNLVKLDVKLSTLYLLRHAMHPLHGSSGRPGHHVPKAAMMDHAEDSDFVMVENLANKGAKPRPRQVLRCVILSHVIRHIKVILSEIDS